MVWDPLILDAVTSFSSIDDMSVSEQICEQASYTLHHLSIAKLFTENSPITRLRDILRG